MPFSMCKHRKVCLVNCTVIQAWNPGSSVATRLTALSSPNTHVSLCNYTQTCTLDKEIHARSVESSIMKLAAL